MIGAEDIKALLANLESDRVERTVSTTDTDKFAQAVCAFANDLPGHRQPGYLILGAHDKTGGLSGLKVTDQLLQNLAALRSDGNIQPLPALAIARVPFPDGELAVVEVTPADLPPVRYKGQVWVRVGPRKAIASEHEERMLAERRVAATTSFDASPCADASLDDLSLRLFEEYRAQVVAPDVIEANHRSIEEQLASLRFFDLKRGCPTHAGILLFGKNPRYFMPGAYVQFLRLPAEVLSETPVDQAEISGDLRTVLDAVRDKFRAANVSTMVRRDDMTERLVPDFPEVAFRELMNNAVLHRDYRSNTPIRFYWFSDRIEIQSPGALFGEVTADNFRRTNSYRNPVIAEAMKSLGYVNRFGYGIQLAEAELARIGSPPLEFVFDRSISVAMRRRPA